LGGHLLTYGTICFLALFVDLDISLLLLCLAAGQLFLNASYIWYLVRHRSDWLPLRPDWKIIGGLLQAGLNGHVATIATQLYIYFDQIWVFEVARERETGLYNMAVMIGAQLMVLPMTIQEVLYPRVMETEAEDAALVIRVTRCAFFAFLGCLAVVFLIA